MKCQQAQEWMSRAMDGELPAADQALLDRHVAGCPECRAAQAAWRQAGERLRAEPVVIPPAEVMWNDVRRAIRSAGAEPAPEVSGWRLKWAFAGVGAALLGLGLWGAWQAAAPRGAGVASVPAEPAVEWAEAELPGASTMVYEDAEHDTVVIWLMTAENGGGAPKGT